MKRAVIVYRSRTGTTRRLAEEIGRFLASRDIEPRVVSVGDCDVRALGDVDFLLLGAWTSGLMIVRQHPFDAVRVVNHHFAAHEYKGQIIPQTQDCQRQFDRLRQRLA